MEQNIGILISPRELEIARLVAQELKDKESVFESHTIGQKIDDFSNACATD